MSRDLLKKFSFMLNFCYNSFNNGLIMNFASVTTEWTTDCHFEATFPLAFNNVLCAVTTAGRTNFDWIYREIFISQYGIDNTKLGIGWFGFNGTLHNFVSYIAIGY